MPERDLGLVLTDIGARLEWPGPSTGFSQRVVARLEAAPPRRPVLRRFVPALGTLGVLAAAILTFSPATRDAVADFIGIGGVRIQTGDPDEIPDRPLGTKFGFGILVDEGEALGRVDFDARVPESDLLGDADEIYVNDDRPPGGLIAFVYGERAGLPMPAGADVGTLITEFRGDIHSGEFFKKTTSDTDITLTHVGEAEAYWLSGEPHSFFYENSAGEVVLESVRLVGNVLLWEDDGITFRIETFGSLEQALEIAEGLT
jgi:hypothetical protein